jgi:hypothetical protein
MKSVLRIVVLVLILTSVSDRVDSWGRWGHYRISELAIASLPDTLKRFFESEAENLVAKSVGPDEARRWDEQEQYRHYIDIDAYGEPPFHELPRAYSEAVAKFGALRIDTTGTLPWTIVRFTDALTRAFKGGNRDTIIHIAAHLGHYVADAHVPLHTTVNYDGRSSGQRGVHARWESHLSERFGDTFNLAPGSVRFFKSPRDDAFRIILESYTKVDSVLGLDRLAQEKTEGRVVTAEASRDQRIRLSDAYYAEYHEVLSGMVERRLQDAISAVASYWYTAWVGAGRPEISDSAKAR